MAAGTTRGYEGQRRQKAHGLAHAYTCANTHTHPHTPMYIDNHKLQCARTLLNTVSSDKKEMQFLVPDIYLKMLVTGFFADLQM